MSRARTVLLLGALVCVAAAGQFFAALRVAWLVALPMTFAEDGDRVPATANRLIALHVGPLALLAGTMALRMKADVPLPPATFHSAEIAVYRINGGDDVAPVLRSPGAGWLPVVRVRDGEDRVAIFARVRGRRLRALDLLTSDGEYLVHVRLRGRLQRAARALVAWALERATEGGGGGGELTPGWRRTPPGRPGP